MSMPTQYLTDFFSPLGGGGWVGVNVQYISQAMKKDWLFHGKTHKQYHLLNRY